MPSVASTVPFLAYEGRRNIVSLGIAAVVAALALITYGALWEVRFTADTVALTTFVFWIGYSLAFLILTQVTFGRLDAATLRSWIGATNTRSRSLAIPTSAAQWAILAVIAVILVIALPGLLDSPLANGLSFAVVITAWLVTVSAYAVHYARLDTQEPSLDIPGRKGDSPVFADHYYLSAQISTTFSSADITLLTTRTRKVVTGQAFIAFAFSTFIIALLITVLFLSN